MNPSNAWECDYGTVLAAERRHIGFKDDQPGWGVALSGGGIRSAAFGLGVLQAMVRKGLLEKVDYLSTVSGGGYIGTSLTWFLSRLDEGGKRRWGTSEKDFPFGYRPTAEEPGDHGDSQNRILNFIRQNVRYLTPGIGVDTVALVGTALRGMLSSLVFYFGVMMLGVWLLYFVIPHWLGSGAPAAFQALVMKALIYVAGFFAVVAVGYSLNTVWGKDGESYRTSHALQMVVGFVLKVAMVLAAVWAIPAICSRAPHWSFVSGSPLAIATAGFWLVNRLVLVPKRLRGLLVTVVAAALLVSLLVLAYSITQQLWDHGVGVVVGPDIWVLYVPLGGVLLLWAGISNLNLVSHHRMYRHRLMELFMPGDKAVEQGRWKFADEADRFPLSAVKTARPYHLINANVILVNSSDRRFKGRGGDSFVFSPLYCGSQATGWCPTPELTQSRKPDDEISLATAMAISGAAMNPHAGPGGLGPMRMKLVSMLMTILNLRLGFWAVGPHSRFVVSPNYLFPGLQSFFGQGYKSRSAFIELSDGGHFDNLGLYELIRRRVKTIVVADGAQDAGFRFGDLASVVERVRVDFGVIIDFDEAFPIEDMVPDADEATTFERKMNLSKRGFAVAKIRYQKGEGRLIYIKSSLTKGLPADIYGYKNRLPGFPDESTADQFFDEAQFEAYRELGYQLGKGALGELMDVGSTG